MRNSASRDATTTTIIFIFLLFKLFTKVHEPAVASSNLGVPDNLRVGNNSILTCTCLSICERLYFISHLTGYQL